VAAFATPAQLASALGSADYTGTALTRATELLDYASALIRLACGGQVLEADTGAQEEFAGDDEAHHIFLTQRPVTAVSSLTIDGVAFTDYVWTRWGVITREDEGAWSEGPILVTYDHGYAADSDEIVGLRALCIEVAARAFTNNPGEQFGEEIPEARGFPVQIFLTSSELESLANYGPVPVG
jgi:hypothetical protein